MADQPSLNTEAFERLNRDLLPAEFPARDRDQILGLAEFLNADMNAMRKFPVGESEPATVYNPAADQ